LTQTGQVFCRCSLCSLQSTLASPRQLLEDFGEVTRSADNMNIHHSPRARFPASPIKRVLCVLNFKKIPSVEALQRRTDQARIEAYIATGCSEIHVTTQITSSAEKIPQEMYVQFHDHRDHLDSVWQRQRADGSGAWCAGSGGGRRHSSDSHRQNTGRRTRGLSFAGRGARARSGSSSSAQISDDRRPDALATLQNTVVATGQVKVGHADESVRRARGVPAWMRRRTSSRSSPIAPEDLTAVMPSLGAVPVTSQRPTGYRGGSVGRASLVPSWIRRLTS